MTTDIHCHILPGIDDGSKELAQSLAMARIAVGDGINTTFATPHHLNGVYRNPAELVRAEVERLQEALDAHGIALKLLPGSEHHLVPELPDALAAGTALTMGDFGRAVLVELPVHTVPVGSEDLLEQIRAQNLTPIIAHPERNSELRRHPERLADWISMGCLAQVTGQSCTGLFGEAVQASARDMILRGLIHFIASDAHRDRRRIPEISPARAQVAEWTNDQVAELIADTFPTTLARGEVPEPDILNAALPPPEKAGWWQRWFQ